MPALSLNVKGGVWMQKLKQAAAIALLKPILSCSIAKVGHQGGLLYLVEIGVKIIVLGSSKLQLLVCRLAIKAQC